MFNTNTNKSSQYATNCFASETQLITTEVEAEAEDDTTGWDITAGDFSFNPERNFSQDMTPQHLFVPATPPLNRKYDE